MRGEKEEGEGGEGEDSAARSWDAKRGSGGRSEVRDGPSQSGYQENRGQHKSKTGF